MVLVEDLGNTDKTENDELVVGIADTNFIDDGKFSNTSNPKPKTSSKVKTLAPLQKRRDRKLGYASCVLKKGRTVQQRIAKHS